MKWNKFQCADDQPLNCAVREFVVQQIPFVIGAEIIWTVTDKSNYPFGRLFVDQGLRRFFHGEYSNRGGVARATSSTDGSTIREQPLGLLYRNFGRALVEGPSSHCGNRQRLRRTPYGVY